MTTRERKFIDFMVLLTSSASKSDLIFIFVYFYQLFYF